MSAELCGTTAVRYQSISRRSPRINAPSCACVQRESTVARKTALPIPLLRCAFRRCDVQHDSAVLSWPREQTGGGRSYLGWPSDLSPEKSVRSSKKHQCSLTNCIAP